MRRVNRFYAALWSVAAVTLLSGGPAQAWGPQTDTAIVSAAAHVLDRDPAFNLEQMLKYVVEGARIPDDQLKELHGSYSVDPVGAIQREMVLLQSMRGDRVDPYFAYRLGVLGKMVAATTAPLATAPQGIRDRYYADVDNAINGVEMRPAPRKLVDPRPYFSRVRSQAAEDDQTLLVDYQAGQGFTGFARSSLSGDVSRSVNAVADVWYTILTSRATAFQEPSSGKRQYILGAIAFYLNKGNLEEVSAAYDTAREQGILDVDLKKSIGDLFYDAGRYDRAIQEYQAVLKQEPGRRDVVERVANYYELVGDDAEAQGNLEAARDAYEKALDVDSLHPDAQRKLLDVEARMYARDERLLKQRTAVEEAREFENRAEEAATKRDYARAISLLREAQQRYSGVTQEFPSEARMASLGMKNVTARMRGLKQELITNSQTLSGSAYRVDAEHLAAQTQDVSEEAFRQMLSSEYRSAVQALSNQMAGQFAP